MEAGAQGKPQFAAPLLPQSPFSLDLSPHRRGSPAQPISMLPRLELGAGAQGPPHLPQLYNRTLWALLSGPADLRQHRLWVSGLGTGPGQGPVSRLWAIALCPHHVWNPWSLKRECGRDSHSL